MAVSSRSPAMAGAVVSLAVVRVVISISLLRGKYWRVGFAGGHRNPLRRLVFAPWMIRGFAVNRWFTAALPAHPSKEAIARARAR